MSARRIGASRRALRGIGVLVALAFTSPAFAGEVAVGAMSLSFHGQGSNTDVPVEVFYPVAPTHAVEEETHSFVFPAPVARDAPPLTDVRRGLVMFSHGHEGTPYDLFWLAEPLVRAGFIVAAVEHPNNHLFDVDWIASLHVWRRPQDVSSALTGMLSHDVFGPLIDQNRIAAAGHSVGGYTVLALAGARYNVQNARRICREETPFDLTCNAVKGIDFSRVDYTGSNDSYRDPRVRWVFAFAPAVGEALEDEPLNPATRTMIWAGDSDPIAPHQSHAERWARRLGVSIKMLEGGDHYTFITRCNWFGSAIGAAACADPPGFDRRAKQREIAIYVVQTLTYSRPKAGIGR